jgi:hypothetical protein
MSVERTTRSTDAAAPFFIDWACAYSVHEPGAEHTENGDGVAHTLYTPVGFVYQHEIIRRDPTVSSKQNWNDFDHYKSFRSDTAPGGYIPSFFQWVDYYPHIWKSQNTIGRFGVTGWHPTNEFASPFGEPQMPVEGMHDPYVEETEDQVCPDPAVLDKLIERGLNSILPEVKQELSSINSALELRDFASLPRTLRAIRNLVVNPRATLRSWFRGGADGYLQAKFNVMPLLSDIRGLYTAVRNVEKRVNHLVNGAGQPQRRHFTYSWSEYPDGREDSFEYYGLPTSGISYETWNPGTLWSKYYLTRIVRNNPSVFHVEIEYNYNYTQYQREHALLLSLLDEIGINLDPKIVWNAIPWSFVVDWVLGVSRWLDQFKVSNMEPQINIRRALWSIRRTRNVYFEQTCLPVYPLQPYPIDPIARTLPVVSESSYKRRAFMPSTNSLSASGLSPTEISLGAALVLTRGRHRNKRR